jgi:3-hydroxyacyl-CoA dehydrogenase
MVEFGYPIGPFATADLSGLDIGYDSRRRRAAQNPNYRKLPIADAIVEAGRLGQKTGAGWFRYEKGDRTVSIGRGPWPVKCQAAMAWGAGFFQFQGRSSWRRWTG